MASYEVPLTSPLGNQAWVDTAATNTIVQVTIAGSTSTTVSAGDKLHAADIDNTANTTDDIYLKIFLKATSPSLDSDPTGNGAHHFIFRCPSGARIQYTCPQGWELDAEGTSTKLWYAVTNVATPGNDGTALAATCTVRLLLDVG